MGCSTRFPKEIIASGLNCLRFAIPPTQVWTLAYLFSVFIVVCYLSLVILNLLFEGAKIQQMLTSVLSDGAKTWRMGRCTLHVGRCALHGGGWPKVPNGSKSAPKRNQRDPKWSQRDLKWSQGVPKGSQGDPNGSQMGAKIEPKIDQKAFTLHFGRKGWHQGAKKATHRNYNPKFGLKKR